MKRIAILAACLALAACGTTRIERPEPIIRTVEVKVPVDDPACARGALARLGPAPIYPDNPAAIQAAASIFERVQLLLAGRLMRAARERAITDALEACAGG